MNLNNRRMLPLAMLILTISAAQIVDARKEDRNATYCNPMDLPYRFAVEGISRREAADPTLMTFGGEYWLFPSKSGGYWHSKDLLHWQFIAATGYPLEAYAPTVLEMKGKAYLTSFSQSKMYVTDDLKSGQWREAGDFGQGFADPALFLDDDGRLYLYEGCSGTPTDRLHVVELDPRNGFKMLRSVDIPASRDMASRGWEVPGDANEKTSDQSWLEGSWMNKYNGKYYLQYGGPGTQFKSYGDGVLVSDHPMGPFTYAPYSPFSFKPTGFITGAGHGSTFTGLDKRLWHIATMTISVKDGFERRLGLFPAEFRQDGTLVADTYLGDYPHYIGGNRRLTGWMLLSRNKSVTASSSLPEHTPVSAVDENVRTWWSAATGDPGEWLQIDLGASKRVEAVQINFADEGSTTMGRSNDGYGYLLEASVDGRIWQPIIDRRKDYRDSPHDYIVLPKAVETRYLRLTNQHSPNGAKFSVSGLRAFGSGQGNVPGHVNHVTATRDSRDARRATVSWEPVAGADFYIVRLGTKANLLTLNYQVYDATMMDIRSLTVGNDYQVTVDAVNENGITPGAVRIPLPTASLPPPPGDKQGDKRAH